MRDTNYWQVFLSQVRSSMARIFNALAFLLNSETYLPRYIFIIPDRNIVDHLKFNDEGLGELMEKIAKWLVTQVDRVLDGGIEELKAKHAGAIQTCTVIWVAILRRPTGENTVDSQHSNLPLALSTARRKVNFALEDQLVNCDAEMMLMETHDLTRGNNNFDNRNRLNADGRWEFWREIDHLFKKFDRGEVCLNPIQHTTQNRYHHPLAKTPAKTHVTVTKNIK